MNVKAYTIKGVVLVNMIQDQVKHSLQKSANKLKWTSSYVCLRIISKFYMRVLMSEVNYTVLRNLFFSYLQQLARFG